MNPSVYLYNETDNGIELYLGGCSTLDGLSLIDKHAQLNITSFGATCYKKYGWATEKEIPELKSIDEAMVFLKSEGDIGIIEFNANIFGMGTLSTHDDGECHFILKSKHQCLTYLKLVVPQQYSDMFINKLLNNPGLYLTCDSTGNVNKYASINNLGARSCINTCLIARLDRMP